MVPFTSKGSDIASNDSCQYSNFSFAQPLCVIVIVGFDQDRDGLNEDISAIKDAFCEHFNIKLEMLINENRKTISDKFSSFHTDDQWLEIFRNAHFVAVFCLSHGTADGQIELKSKNEISDARRLLLCPLFKIQELDYKLKWLVVQACRGELNNYRPLQNDGEDQVYPNHHFISYCTGEGTESFQRGTGGKVYIQELCKEIKRNIREKRLYDMIESVNTRIGEFAKTQGSTTFQKPAFKYSYEDYTFF
ncbi:uncharacterized protein LOC133331415 [Musca vetustissima]|uniref:uncharacterized protein LOC133331415 n=1 Tax=Musca vetustissima TaxID=27455 RepID=UPI002AB733C2|nr:uncharacterized protein LOC133331415 [Musca vetustissima]